LIAIVIIGLIQNANLKSENDELRDSIIAQENIINNLTNDNENLINNIAQLENTNNNLQNDKELLKLNVQELLVKIENLEQEIEQAKKEVEQSNKDSETSNRRDFKSYMSYQSITTKSSKQWQLQQIATTNEDGIRCIDDIPMVAVGTGWGLRVGDIAWVTCENGNRFKVMVGDIKSDAHTDAERKTTVANGCRCEFIVDKDKLDPTVRVRGSLATLDKYSGYVVNIEKAD
jgi:predicted RNase H-like nuclease (RuvC/YqgF family)